LNFAAVNVGLQIDVVTVLSNIPWLKQNLSFRHDARQMNVALATNLLPDSKLVESNDDASIKD
jgi:hypothetical protein